MANISFDVGRLSLNRIEPVQLIQYVRLQHRCRQHVIVVVDASREHVVFAFVSRKLQTERTVSWSLAILFRALICRFSFLTPITVEHIDTVAIGVESFSSFADHLDVLRRKNFRYLVPYRENILKCQLVKDGHINVDHLLIVFVSAWLLGVWLTVVLRVVLCKLLWVKYRF